MIQYVFSNSCIEKILAIPLGRYQTCNFPYVPLRFVVTAPMLQLILIPRASLFTPLRYFPLLKAVMVEHPSRYAQLFGELPPTPAPRSTVGVPPLGLCSPILLLLGESCGAVPTAPCSTLYSCMPNDPLLHSGSSGTPPCCWPLGPRSTVPSSCSLCCLRLLPSSHPSLLVPLSGLLSRLCFLFSYSLKEGHAHVVWAGSIGHPALC